MLDYGQIRDIFKSSDTLDTKHLVLAEWNMNRSIKIQHYGLYSQSSSAFQRSDKSINRGQHYLIYDELLAEQSEISPTEFYYSKLASVFEPFRPDPGIVLLNKWTDVPIVRDAKNIQINRLSPSRPRFYPQTRNRSYDYFHSGKMYDKLPEGSVYDIETIDGGTASVQSPTVVGVAKAGGSIRGVNPFVVYEDSFPMNKIVIKVQNHVSVPDLFSVDILNENNTWTTVYPLASSSSADFSDGIFEIYFNGASVTENSFTKNVKYVNELANISASSNADTIIIKGLRFNVYSMTDFRAKKTPNGPLLSRSTQLELLEISPRLEVDLTSYTESFTINADIPESATGLPVGGVVSSTGNISFSNEEKSFLFASKLAELNLLVPDVLFKFYQLFTVASVEYAVPIKQMYSDAWTSEQDFSMAVSLQDEFKLFRQKKVPDLVFPTDRGIPFSVIILMLLDNCGITGYEFKKSTGKISASVNNDSEDTRIYNFFCRKEQTLMEVLNDIAVSTQCSMYIDASGKLNVLTKERLTNNVSRDHSTSASSNGTDFWILGDEVRTSDTEYSSASAYSANIISITESRVNPITDGSIQYHNYNVARSPGKLLLEAGIDQDLIKDVPASILAFSDFTFKSTMLWSPGDGNEQVLGAANVLTTIPASGPAQYFKYTSGSTDVRIIEAYDEEDAARTLYNTIKSACPSLINALEIQLETNELPTIQPYKGYIAVENEIIKYNGKIFSFGSSAGRVVVMSSEEYEELKSVVPISRSLIPMGVMVDVEFEPTKHAEDINGRYKYRIVSDGRGAMDSRVSKHSPFTEELFSASSSSLRFNVILGETKITSSKFTGKPEVSTVYDLTKSLDIGKKVFRNKSENFKKAYLGYLKIKGPPSPARDQRNLELIASASTASGASVNFAAILNATDRQVDHALLGVDQTFREFLPYVYTMGEKYISGQQFNVGFRPNYISTRIRVTSDPKELNDGTRIQQTNSAIAGLVVDFNEDDKTGYYLEVQSEADNRKPVQMLFNNLRFYKVYLNEKGKYVAKLLFTVPVAALTVTTGQVFLEDAPESSFDPFFTLSVAIERSKDYVEYTAYYGDNIAGQWKERINRNKQIRSNKVAIFVRNDSEVIVEDLLAASLPYDTTAKMEKFFFSKPINQVIQAGTVPIDRQFFLKKAVGDDLNIKVYYNDFANLAREVKEYDVRFDQIALKSKLIDISNINPQYMVYRYEPSPFGAKFVVRNTSSQYIKMTDDAYLPLFITGIALEEVNSGNVDLSDIYEKIDDSFTRRSPLSFNQALYGKKDFNLDSKYIQRRAQAEYLMRWASSKASRQRLKFSCEIFATPILELGDKVRVYDPNREYYIDNPVFGDKTFTVTSISYSANQDGPRMTVSLVEVG